jgi:hypothetical protein
VKPGAEFLAKIKAHFCSQNGQCKQHMASVLASSNEGKCISVE